MLMRVKISFNESSPELRGTNSLVSNSIPEKLSNSIFIRLKYRFLGAYLRLFMSYKNDIWDRFLLSKKNCAVKH